MTIIRAETAADHPAVLRINESAFGRPNEAILVDALREAAHPTISLVAVMDDEVVGHIFFSPVSIESETTMFKALGLGPLAVLPEFQNRGIGSRLVIEGLGQCRHIGYDVVVVVGHPNYYPRFGFMPARPKGFSCEFTVRDEVFMVTELTPGALRGLTGLVKYRPEFNDA